MMKNKLTKKILAGVLAFAVAVAGFICVPDEAKAAENDALKWQPVAYETFAEKIANHEAPDYVPEAGNTENAGYLFAGWFTEANGTPITSAEGLEGEVYAKFIPAKLTGIAVQTDISDSTDGSESSLRNMRIVSLIDSDEYTTVGFNVYGRYDADDNGTNETEWTMYEYNSTEEQTVNVYTGLYQYDKNNNKTPKTPAQVFGSVAEKFYFTTVSITNIPADYHNATIVAQPYWVTLDGTYVEGLAEFNRINDYTVDENGNETIIRNVSVTLKDATNIAAGMLEITLPDAFSALTVEVENGRVFDQMQDYRAENSNKIRCIGNVTDITTHAENPNSVFVNLRFTTTTEAISLGANDFEITIPASGGFCTNKEVSETVSAWDVLY